MFNARFRKSYAFRDYSGAAWPIYIYVPEEANTSCMHVLTSNSTAKIMDIAVRSCVETKAYVTQCSVTRDRI
jgi:hypothetical protein